MVAPYATINRSPPGVGHREHHAGYERHRALHEEFERRIKTQCLLPCAETAAMLFWALLASGQITMRRVDGWPSLDRSPTDLDLAA